MEAIKVLHRIWKFVKHINKIYLLPILLFLDLAITSLVQKPEIISYLISLAPPTDVSFIFYQIAKVITLKHKFQHVYADQT